ncbi:MAG: hypothetical protein A2W22_03080 [Candidatus Levybacteria bacterium RBG_16_35_11]|nr:MAG: hypothetical protein A2W22_03080 [Candidatus Levybacteria bacterium RBG_16_35_11]
MAGLNKTCENKYDRKDINMKKEKAIFHLTSLMTATQKIRSIMDENELITDRDDIEFLHFTTGQASEMWKYVWGEACILPILSKLLDDYEITKELAPHDFYNMIFIAASLEPLLATATLVNDPEFPDQASLEWLKGWEDEQ